MKSGQVFIVIFLSVFILTGSVFAQIGGDNTYEFLNLASSARIGAMGGKMVPVRDNDLNLAFGNPALLNQTMNRQLTFSGVKYYAGVSYGDVAYAHSLKNAQTVSGGIHFVSYGTMSETDVNGEETGTFKAGEYSFNVGYARDLMDSTLSMGASLKTVYSSLAEYTSFGLAADIGVNYCNYHSLFDLSLVVKNAGSQLKPYHTGVREELPFEVQFGVSKKLSKAPFRFSIILHHLEKYDLSYTDPSTLNQVDPISGDPVEVKITTADKILKHVIFGTEILFSKNFHVRAGYNFQRRNELGVDTRMSTAGLSWGFGFRVSKFLISYGRARYHLAGSTSLFSISTNLSSFVSR